MTSSANDAFISANAAWLTAESPWASATAGPAASRRAAAVTSSGKDDTECTRSVSPTTTNVSASSSSSSKHHALSESTAEAGGQQTRTLHHPASDRPLRNPTETGSVRRPATGHRPEPGRHPRRLPDRPRRQLRDAAARPGASPGRSPRAATPRSRRGPVAHGYGAVAYLAAYDVDRAHVFGRCEGTTGIIPFARLVEQVMTQEPYASADRCSRLLTTARLTVDKPRSIASPNSSPTPSWCTHPSTRPG